MNRPYIICHMTMSIDGKVTGNFLSRGECENAVERYYDINRSVKANGFICGRVTMEESFTSGWYPDLQQYTPVCRFDDYIPEALSGFYAVAFDSNGKLGWRSNVIVDDDPGYGGAQIVEVLTEQVDPRYLGYLRALKIPYIVAGKVETDVELALLKLNTLFGAEALLLEGGSIINGAFQRCDAIDELSLVVAPVVADATDKPLFSDSAFSTFSLTNATTENGVLTLTYRR